jgi:hypothetical protein
MHAAEEKERKIRKKSLSYSRLTKYSFLSPDLGDNRRPITYNCKQTFSFASLQVDLRPWTNYDHLFLHFAPQLGLDRISAPDWKSDRSSVFASILICPGRVNKDKPVTVSTGSFCLIGWAIASCLEIQSG